MEGSEAESLPAEPGEADCEQATEEQLKRVAELRTRIAGELLGGAEANPIRLVLG
jgi:hypothetical protein